MNRYGWIASSVLLILVAGVAGALAAWKHTAEQAAAEVAASQPEPMELVAAVMAEEREHRRTTTAIGTVLALRSITLRNELPGTVREVRLTPGEIVEAGTLLVALDVSVEEAELKTYEAQARLAQTLLRRVERMHANKAASDTEVDRAQTELDVALAQIGRIKAIMARKTIRAPFRARVGLSDVHPGQYLEEGSLLTTLQGVDDAAHVDFTVAQQVAAGLNEGDVVEVVPSAGAAPLVATIVATDARVNPETRNATVRARIANGDALTPGSSVRVRVPVSPPTTAVVVPASAVRRGPAGDHVFVIAPGEDGKDRAYLRAVQTGSVLGDEALIHAGVAPGERVATAGSFKLREGVLVALQNPASASASRVR